jgi:hypothetical protein
MGDLKLSSQTYAQKNESRLEHLLDIFDVVPPGNQRNVWQIDGDPVSQWYAVLSGAAIIALFRDEHEADRFRLLMIGGEMDRWSARNNFT